MPIFLEILAEFLTEDLLYRQVKDFLEIRKGELKDAAFEKFYKTLVVHFIDAQKGLDQEQAKKFFGHDNTLDGVLAYLYRFTDPDPTIRDKTKAALCRWADHFKITGDANFTNAQLAERFLTVLEEELRRDANKSLLPYFAEIRGDIAEVKEEIKSFREQFEIYAAEQKARAERVTQIDPSGEQLIVAGKLVYDSTPKVEPSPALPILRCDLEAIDEANHLYRAVITNESGKELHTHNFTLKPDDAFLLEANHFLEHDGLRDYRTHLALESDRTFTRRLGNYFYDLIMGANGALRGKVEDGALETGFQFVLSLDTEAELLWQVPWEYLHDSEEFLGLSGNAHVVRTPKGAGSLRVSAIPQPLKILVVVSNPSDEGEFDSERALAAIQEALDYSRRLCWVELDYLEEATFAHFQSRLAAFQPHVVHYLGHGGRNVAQSAGLSHQPGETYLAFQNDGGAMEPLWGKDLKRLLANTPSVQLLVLSGCMTGQTAFTDALAGVGTALLREKLPALVVMQYSVLVDTAIQFAKVFYEAVGRGESLSRGLTHVRQVLAQSRGEHRADWGIPALYLRSLELQLVDPRAPKRVAEKREEAVSIGDLPVVAGFVGRTAELRQLRETVRHPQKPVIYVWGLGGIGKTSLTAKLIEKLQQEKAIEGHLVIRCDKIEPTFASVAEKLGNFIKLLGKTGHADAGINLQDSSEDIEVRVSKLNKAIKARRYLIVFDNFESLFSEKAPQIGRLADAPLQEFFQVLPLLLGHPHTIRLFDAYVAQYGLDTVLQYVEQQAANSSKPKEIEKWTPTLLAQIAKLAAKRGRTQLAQTLTASLLEMHHHLSAACEYEQAVEVVAAIYDFIAMIGRREVAKALLRQSITSLEGFNKYVVKANLASLLYEEGKWQEAMATYQECIGYFESNGAKKQMAQTIGQQAQIYQDRGECDKALELERRAMEVYEEVKDQEGIVRTHYRVAQLLFGMKHYDEALVAVEQALAKARAIHNQQYEATCLHQFGITLNKLNRPQEAFARFQESLELTEKIGDRAVQADTLGEMGKILMLTGQFEAAMNFFQRAIAIYFELNFPIKVAITLEVIGYTFEQQDHFSEALRLKHQYAVPPENIARTERNIARVKGKMGQKR